MEILKPAFDAIVAHARESLPNECCGLLVGTPGRIQVTVRARNLEESPTSFLVDPLDHFTAIRLARMRGLAVVGVYHSHPATAALPSPRDLQEATYREYVYIIASPAEPPEMHAFRLAEGAFVEIPLVTAESPAER